MKFAREARDWLEGNLLAGAGRKCNEQVVGEVCTSGVLPYGSKAVVKRRCTGEVSTYRALTRTK